MRGTAKHVGLGTIWVILLMLAACQREEIRFPAPEWALPDLQGQRVSSTAWSNQVVLVNFWATWCPPCRQEIPGFIALQKKFGTRGVTVVGIAMDAEGAKAVEPFARRLGVNYPLVLGDAEVAEQFGGVAALPTTFFVDRQGQVVDRVVGYRSESFFENRILQLLAAH